MIFSGTKAEADHMVGADITYRCIDTLKFEITLKWYRSCEGITLDAGGSPRELRVSCTSGSASIVRLNLIGIRDITPLCATEPSNCVPENTAHTGEGVEVHTFRGIVDFNVAPLNTNSLAGCTGKIIFSASVAARNTTITTGPRGIIYTDAELDISKAPCNTSPGLTSEPVAVLCCNQPFFFNNGALDTANFDSLSYSWGQPRQAVGSQSTYGGNFAFNNPFTAYYPPGSNPFPFNNPNANPPIGIYLDPLTGDIIVTPTNCGGEVTILSDTSSAENPSYYYSTDTASYCANLTVTTNHGCMNDNTLCVVVGPDLIVFIPNAFTPNLSGPDNNEGFRAIISGEKTMELTIFDRWGE
ncbi:MAG: hypothetical protein QMC70_11485, partial [Bacteroidia bacterium]